MKGGGRDEGGEGRRKEGLPGYRLPYLSESYLIVLKGGISGGCKRGIVPGRCTVWYSKYSSTKGSSTYLALFAQSPTHCPMYVIHHPSPTICLRRGVLGEEEDKLMAFPQPFLLLA